MVRPWRTPWSSEKSGGSNDARRSWASFLLPVGIRQGPIWTLSARAGKNPPSTGQTLPRGATVRAFLKAQVSAALSTAFMARYRFGSLPQTTCLKWFSLDWSVAVDSVGLHLRRERGDSAVRLGMSFAKPMQGNI